MTTQPPTLLLGWGNEGRRDDGLGPAFVRLLAERALPRLTVASGYQLQVEDAFEVTRYPRVIFVDADRSGPEPFSWRRLFPGAHTLSFSSHSVTPDALLAIGRELFDREPEAWLLGIRGYEFDRFDESLSRAARENLAAAADFLGAALESGRLDEVTSSLTELEGAK